MRKVILWTALVSAGVFSTANAQWERTDEIPYDSVLTYKYEYQGDQIARWLGVHQYGQPNYYTCGATNISMLVLWETLKDTGSGLKFTPSSIYRYVNDEGKDDDSGLNADELKNGLSKVVRYTNLRKNRTLDVTMVEKKYGDVDAAIEDIFQKMEQNFSPVILYGNVIGGSPGLHYYLGTGAVYCPQEKCGRVLAGLYINDSVYGSEYYEGSELAANAKEPREYVRSIDLEDIWEKTGSAFPWNKRHIFVQNSSNKKT